MFRRKYRDERNSRRNRRWLQDEIDASEPLPDCESNRQDCSDTEPILAIGFSVKPRVAPAPKFPGRLIPFSEFVDRRFNQMN